jgi:uncharacterized cysteine cluster protein YcgN (CxxCxxCC family)
VVKEKMKTSRITKPFWEIKSLNEMTPEEWEALCDGCAKCCLFKIEDEDTGEVFYTNIACRMLDFDTCRCKIYEHRFKVIKDCLSLTYEKLLEIDWLPKSCAYRRLAEGRGLAWWHPLISGTRDTLRQAGISVCCQNLVRELQADLSKIEEYVIDWIEQ